MRTYEDHCDMIFAAPTEARSDELDQAILGACSDAVVDHLLRDGWLFSELDTSLCGCDDSREARDLYAAIHGKVSAFLAGRGALEVHTANLRKSPALSALAARALYGSNFALDDLGLSDLERLRLHSLTRQAAYLELCLRYVTDPSILGARRAA